MKSVTRNQQREPFPKVNAQIHCNGTFRKICAPETWESATSGEGIVVATIDGGVNYQHEALVEQYRGTISASRSNYNHSYNWSDYAYGSLYPFDTDGHGTNVQGILSAKYGYGVAPSAKWISAKAFNWAGYAARKKTHNLIGIFGSQFLCQRKNLIKFKQ
jgi:subtilisin family serine protease